MSWLFLPYRGACAMCATLISHALSAHMQTTGCGDGVTCHVRTFLHGSCRLTMSIATLPSNEALPGEDRGQVWTWLRPRGATAEVNRAVRRCAEGSAWSAALERDRQDVDSSPFDMPWICVCWCSYHWRAIWALLNWLAWLSCVHTPMWPMACRLCWPCD